MAKLDRDIVVRAALGLLNEVGADGLTTRRLAERLKVQQPALYWHFPNKRALLDTLAEAMLTENHTRAMPRLGEDWRVFLSENARSFRKALLAYRDGARIHAGTRPSAPQSGAIEAQIRLLCAGGFAPRDAARALAAISHYVVGAVIEEQASPTDMTEREGAEPGSSELSIFLQTLFHEVEQDGADTAFDYGLENFIAGLERRLST
ncbi:Tetracycline repressor protein class G [Bosea sp. 62]|uniref:tetracycline resistance transcriptional repressor TetR n=1 Tax=unclassified Bosea (in: a-proteobacteria) TaxID=2653178 RepID=UPI001258DB4F|nr:MULTISPECIES: tetracycline resistance transcriptional repressor TetR [unclassified Bosea (in: a-proteobacteria)]CAD5255506.1 Tetracycline repressor protein class G [Bosea sp. 7B]CAD5275280.1 Tetracycline repressor protein class G [Bosea sp. 21B]CAD5276416.1 Tetracycline repressor protein class G [Bosea sp. 46]VVT60008.1 Tetracycline repressor protein class G [Bosea sp. EC-HK365B]VXB51437.1 Tetracycline repressor protein class G [Bosea sp. 62]